MKVIGLVALLAAAGAVNGAVLVPRDACSNGVKVCGSGSVSCSGNRCTACSGSKCCTVSAPYSNSCNNATPCVNFDTCTISSGSTPTTSTRAPQSSPSKSSTTQPSRTACNWLARLFGRC